MTSAPPSFLHKLSSHQSGSKYYRTYNIKVAETLLQPHRFSWRLYRQTMLSHISIVDSCVSSPNRARRRWIRTPRHKPPFPSIQVLQPTLLNPQESAFKALGSVPRGGRVGIEPFCLALCLHTVSCWGGKLCRCCAQGVGDFFV